MKLFNSLILTLSSVSAGSYWEPWNSRHGYYWGDYLSCGSNDYVTGTCTSGRKRHCESSLGSDTSHSIKCESDDNKIKISNRCRDLSGSHGDHVTCDNNEVMVGMCASGRTEDCRNGYASHYAKCCKYETKNEKWVSANLPGSTIPFQYPEYSFEKGAGGNCRWKYGKYG